MTRKLLMAVLVAVVGASVTATPGRCAEGNPRGGSPAAAARAVRYGPYATIRRANEVANYWRDRGYNARVIYLGTVDYREYAVDVW